MKACKQCDFSVNCNSKKSILPAKRTFQKRLEAQSKDALVKNIFLVYREIWFRSLDNDGRHTKTHSISPKFGASVDFTHFVKYTQTNNKAVLKQTEMDRADIFVTFTLKSVSRNIFAAIPRGNSESILCSLHYYYIETFCPHLRTTDFFSQSIKDYELSKNLQPSKAKVFDGN